MKVETDAEVGGIVMIDGDLFLVEKLEINVHMVAQKIEPLLDVVKEADSGYTHAPVFYQFSAPVGSQTVAEIEPLVPAS